ncbi:hypothetical protein CNECB9_810014 [Cupriavidus necator]|uniref:Uncharacterized protein n=1 Tax=Cupriavidus necator TaxID=106590 RepID=A0A1K0JRC7_CUPNE|nr:hypothetical protein CNECB9_810014 [Cupriavidus necator]
MRALLLHQDRDGQIQAPYLTHNNRGNMIIDACHGYNSPIDPKILLDYEKPEPTREKPCRAR